MAVELKPGQGLTGHVLESGEPLIVNDGPRDARGFHVPGTPVEDPEVLAMAPLKIRQRTMGVMTVLRFSYDRPFTPSDVELLTPFAVHAALALENAHLYGQIEQQAQHLEAEVVERTRDLALSESRYRALVETSLAGIFQVDLEGRVAYSNQVLLGMLGYQPGEAAGLTDPTQGIASGAAASILEGFFARLPSGAAASIMEGFFARMRGERPASEVYELEMRSRTGEPVPTLVAVSVIRDADGKSQGVTGLVLDISKRKALEAALQAERDRLHAILTNIGDAVMVTDIDGIIEYVNPAWERLNGYPAAEAAGENARLIRSGQHPPEFYAEMGETMAAGQQWVGEVVNRRKDGTLYDAAMTITPIKDEAGNVLTLVAVQHDISALKEIDRMKSQFVSDVSHELRTPLTNIRLYLDLLRGTADPERTTRYLETMDRESGRLAHLIDDLLSLSRLEAGTVNFNPAPTDLNPILRALVDDRRALAANRGLQLTLECEDELPRVLGDERLLTQVFTNLLTNALNYTPAGGKVMLRTRRRHAQAEEFVTAEVADTGLGIPAEEQPLIFRRFFRGHASRKTNAAGTGLGLAICQEILERHSGRIEVESEGVPGKGSLFTVWLPSLTVEAAG
jgi:PAS domain S-box-containing protein